MLFFDKTSKRTKDENGYLVIKDNPIAKAGVFKYLHSELFEDSEDDTIVNVYRDFEELKKVKDKFSNMPIVYNHQWVGEETKQADGAIGSIIGVDEKSQTLFADLIIYNPDLIEAIEKGEEELSPGYTGQIEPKKGMFNSQSYEFVQTPDITNHLAVVANGRAGKDLKIQDSKPKGKEMQKTTVQKIMDSLKKILDEDVKKDVEVKDEEVKAEDADVEITDGVLEDIIRLAQDESMSEEDKLKAISELMSTEKTEDAEAKAEDEKTEDEAVKAEDEKIEDEEDIANVIETIIEKKLEKFTDAQAIKSKRITDTYTRVSDSIGTSFNYAGMSEADIFKFGYEAKTGMTLEKGMDAQTAFTMATAQKRGNTFNDESIKKDSALSKALSKY